MQRPRGREGKSILKELTKVIVSRAQGGVE